MTNRQRRQLASLENALWHLKDAKFDAPRFATFRTELAQSIDRIERLRADQRSAASARTARSQSIARHKHELRVRHLMPISHRGKLLLKGMPGIAEDLRVPHPRDPERKLLDATARIVKSVRPHEAVFINVGFPIDFLAQAERAALDLEQRLADPGRETNAHSVATAALRRELAAARVVILAVGTEIRAQFFGDRLTISLWASVSRVRERIGRPPKRPASKTPDAPIAPRARSARGARRKT